METGSEPPREVSRLLQPKWSPKGNDHVGPCLQGQKLSSTMFWNSFRRCLCWSTRMWDLCGTCKNVNNFVACAVSRSFCRLVANHAEFRGCLLCAPKSGKEFEIWEFVWPCRDLPETGDGPRTYWFDSVRMSSHIMQPYKPTHDNHRWSLACRTSLGKSNAHPQRTRIWVHLARDNMYSSQVSHCQLPVFSIQEQQLRICKDAAVSHIR